MDLSQLQPRTVNVTVQVDHPGCRPATVAVPVVLRPPMLVGLSTTAGALTRQSALDFPNIGYFRDFGNDGDDPDRLPELTPHGTGKPVDLPNAVAHHSWKDDVEQLGGWLNGIRRPSYLTWWHEPPGDVTSLAYRATGARVSQIIDAHPNRRWVLGHGPIVPRFWLDEKGGDPLDWAYPGMTHYGIDCYGRDTTAYRPASRLFGAAFNKVRAAAPGVRLLVPEYGRTRVSADTTGVGRAAAIREDLGWLRQQPDVDAVAYWSNTVREKDGTLIDYRIAADSPEAAALREAMR